MANRWVSVRIVFLDFVLKQIGLQDIMNDSRELSQLDESRMEEQIMESFETEAEVYSFDDLTDDEADLLDQPTKSATMSQESSVLSFGDSTAESLETFEFSDEDDIEAIEVDEHDLSFASRRSIDDEVARMIYPATPRNRSTRRMFDPESPTPLRGSDPQFYYDRMTRVVIFRGFEFEHRFSDPYDGTTRWTCIHSYMGCQGMIVTIGQTSSPQIVQFDNRHRCQQNE